MLPEKISRIMNFAVIVILSVFLFATVAVAEESDDLALFYLSSTPSGDIQLEKVLVVGYMDVYDYGDVSPPYTDSSLMNYDFVVVDSAGSELFRTDVGELDNGLAYELVRSASAFKVVDGSSAVYEQSLSFCDDDGVCEPCKSPGCTVAENQISCADCKSGGADGYCDQVPDGICDPDCDGKRDSDCGKNCDEIGGVDCLNNQDCIGGYFRSSIETDRCCIKGRCVQISDYVETRIEMQNQPSLTITKSGETAASIQQQGIGDYCADNLMGTVCEPSEYCDGKEVEYYYNTYCCVGGCTEYPADILLENAVFAEIQENFTATPAYQEAPVEALLPPQLVPSYDYPEAILNDLPAGKFPHDALVPEVAAPSESAPAASVEGISAAVQGTIDKVNWVYVVAIALGILLLLFVLIGIFRRSATAKTCVEEKISFPDLQQVIDNLVSQGNDYKRIEQLLVQKGFDKTVVDSEIRKNYQKRIEAPKAQFGK